MGVLLLVLMSGTQLCPQASKQAEDHWEQTNFGAEGDSERPVAIPGAALQQLRTSKNRGRSNPNVRGRRTDFYRKDPARRGSLHRRLA